MLHYLSINFFRIKLNPGVNKADFVIGFKVHQLISINNIENNKFPMRIAPEG